MRKDYPYNNITWSDLDSPSDKEVRTIMDEHNLHPRIAEELLSPTFRPRVELYDNCLYLILHFPADKHSHTTEKHQEIDFVIGRDFLITAHYDAVDALHKFSKEFEVSSVIKDKDMGDSGGHIFYHLIKKFYKSVEHELEFIEHELESIDQQIFEGHEKDMVVELSKTSRKLLNFSQALRPHRDVLDSLAVAGKEFFGEDFAPLAQEINDKYNKVKHHVIDLRETLMELRETNNSLVTTKQNEVMKILTIMAFVTFPLSLFASLFGMNTEYFPIVGMENDFWIIVGIMVILALIFFIFFKRRRWL